MESKEKLLSAEEWLKYKYENYTPTKMHCIDMQQYSEYLLKAQLEAILENKQTVYGIFNPVVSEENILHAHEQILKELRNEK